MDLSPLLPKLRALPGYGDLQARLRTGEAGQPERLPRAARPPIIAALAQDLPAPLVVIVARSDRMLTLTQELNAWAPRLEVATFPEPNPLFYERAPWGPRTRHQRAALLARLTAPEQPGAHMGTEVYPQLILTTARAVMTRTLPVREFLAHSRWLPEGGHRRLDQLIDLLVASGYAPGSVVAEPGQFSHRGGILDVWPPGDAEPVRVEFFGDEIDSLRRFDPGTQRSKETVAGVRVSPAREGLPKLYRQEWDPLLPPQAFENDPGSPQSAFLEFLLPWMIPDPISVLDYLPRDASVVLEDSMAFEEAVAEFEDQAVSFREDQVNEGHLPQDGPLPYLTLPELQERMAEEQAADLGMSSDTFEPASALGDSFRPGPRFGGQVRPVLNFLAGRQTAHEATIVVSRQAPRLAELWRERAADAPVRERVPDDLVPGEIAFLKGALAEGWSLESESGPTLHLLTDAEIFGWTRPQVRRRPPQPAAAPESGYSDLEPGDIVVHTDYGVGRFRGLVERTLSGMTREYLLVEYAAGGQVYVPVHQADRVTRYVGVDSGVPTLSSLGTTEWDRVKEQAQESAEEVARDLLDLYAKRMAVQGHAYSPDTVWQQELEAAFPYEETDDQMQAIQAVKNDMESPRPMDRLICGDVGYGKTEVALRAAFKAVMDNRQVAMLVPTTILAQQHFHTFTERLAPYPVEIEMLSRFRSRSEAEQILKRLMGGELDIVIGTHRLLQADVEFRNLGLLIIDEEQRFGVTHKEHLKKMRTEVDVLTLTATPIPRTLYMALTGVRDISTIETPPEERLPVITHVGRYDPRLTRQAVLREMDRGGQVFFVHNRVQTIEAARNRLERLVPEAEIEVAHGQLPERELAAIMRRFGEGEIDVLVSTSIIESGLDIPNANTLIVDRSAHFGLAQLYQLRGRVGRGPVRAYAYFFRQPHSRATQDGLERLEVIAENTQLGAGYSIALRDLELRGAGDLLGTRQHGQIAAVGFHLYTRLLSHAVRRLRREHEGAVPLPDELPDRVEALDVAVELPLPSAIPQGYIEDRELRLQLYRRMADMRDLEAVSDLAHELKDRFGAPPAEVENLIYQLRVKILAARARLELVTTEAGQILLQPQEGWESHLPAALGSDVRRSRRGLWLTRGDQQDWKQRLIEVLEKLGRRAARLSGQRETLLTEAGGSQA